MQVEPVILEGRGIRLEPLTLDHAGGLWQAVEPTPEVFLYSSLAPQEWTCEAFHAYIRQTLDMMPGRIPFAIVLKESRQPVGTSSYFDVRPAHKGLEIGTPGSPDRTRARTSTPKAST